MGTALLAILCGLTGLTHAQPDPLDGRQLYGQACSGCHGADGAGSPKSQVAFDIPLPDFGDCNFASREPDSDWLAIAHQGGPTRAFDPMMPSFGEALTEAELQAILDYIRSLCGEDRWPRGELNLPRPIVTEKAYPEDEAVITTTVNTEGSGGVINYVVFEKRYGALNQLELKLPFGWLEQSDGEWSTPRFGDLAVGWKRVLTHSSRSGSILSGFLEAVFPTGSQEVGFGKGTTVIEPFLSYGQILPAGMFVHLQAGGEIPIDQELFSNEAFWRGAFGATLTRGRWGRAFSPMIEVAAARELESDAATHWDVIPQMQITLNQRQHVMASLGVRLPVDDSSRQTQVVFYVLWDWFDGGLFDGW